jgi:hypothetical protein
MMGGMGGDGWDVDGWDVDGWDGWMGMGVGWDELDDGMGGDGWDGGMAGWVGWRDGVMAGKWPWKVTKAVPARIASLILIAPAITVDGGMGEYERGEDVGTKEVLMH